MEKWRGGPARGPHKVRGSHAGIREGVLLESENGRLEFFQTVENQRK